MKSRINRNDYNAKVYLKLIPSLWSNDKCIHVINLEYLTALRNIACNDKSYIHTNVEQV